MSHQQLLIMGTSSTFCVIRVPMALIVLHHQWQCGLQASRLWHPVVWYVSSISVNLLPHFWVLTKIQVAGASKIFVTTYQITPETCNLLGQIWVTQSLIKRKSDWIYYYKVCTNFVMCICIFQYLLYGSTEQVSLLKISFRYRGECRRG